jgi:hypothetical protein
LYKNFRALIFVLEKNTAGLTMKTWDSRQWIVADLAISALKLIQSLQRTIFYQLWSEKRTKT